MPLFMILHCSYITCFVRTHSPILYLLYVTNSILYGVNIGALSCPFRFEIYGGFLVGLQ